MCAESLFENWFGREPTDLMGKPVWSMASRSAELQAFVERCEAAGAAGTFCEDDHVLTTQILHGYTGSVDVTIQARLAGEPSRCSCCTLCLASTGNRIAYSLVRHVLPVAWLQLRTFHQSKLLP